MNINLNANCNWNCVFCQRNNFLKDHPSVKGPGKEEVKSLLEKDKIDNVLFSGGGEPTMREDLAELISMAKERGIAHIGVETNGCKFKDKKYMQKLKYAGMTYLVLSVYSHRDEVFDKITQAKGSFTAVDACLKNAMELGITISSVLCSITSYNLKELKEIIDYVKSFGVKNICFSFIRPYDDSKHSRDATPMLKEASQYVIEALKYTMRQGLSPVISSGLDVPLCFLEGFEEYSGSAQLILFTKEKDELHLGDRTRVSACSSCTLKQICPGPNTTYVNLYGGNEFIPSKKNLEEIKEKILRK